jgi:hypothetical protein
VSRWSHVVNGWMILKEGVLARGVDHTVSMLFGIVKSVADKRRCFGSVDTCRYMQAGQYGSDEERW